MSEVAISVKNVHKDFILPHEKSTTIKGAFLNILHGKRNRIIERQHALVDVSFEIKKGEFFGIVGRNGSGKSTLLKMLAGIYQPTKGKISIKGRVVPFIELGVGFNGELTGRENIYLNGALLGFSKTEIDQLYDEIVFFAELEKFMDQKLKNYSSGMQVRLAFSLAVQTSADILLVDEVLAVGDADFQRKCFEYFKQLKKEKRTVVFVSHDMGAVREYCNRAILIDKSQVAASGSADEIASKYTRMFFDKSYIVSKDKNYVRWGDGAVKYTELDVNTSKPERVKISLKAKAFSDMEAPNFGFTIRNSEGQGVLGTNTNIKKHRIKQMLKGQEIMLYWSFPNVLNDGEYYVEPAIAWQDGRVADWWERAKQFSVRKEEHTPYLVSPDIKLEVKRVL